MHNVMMVKQISKTISNCELFSRERPLKSWKQIDYEYKLETEELAR